MKFICRALQDLAFIFILRGSYEIKFIHDNTTSSEEIYISI